MVMSPLNARATARIADIKARLQGDRSRMDAEIRALLKRDHAFLLDLVEPFFDGIVAHALATRPVTVSANGSTAIPDGKINDIVRGMTARLGVSPDAAPPRQKASSGHADTIRALAAAQAQRRKDRH